MIVVQHYVDVPQSCRGAVVAIGNFDGVHLGHQALIARAQEIAAGMGAPLAVLGFEPHPQEFFHPGAEGFRLTPFRAKAGLLAKCGVDTMFALPFDLAIAAMTAEQFIRQILVDALGVRAVIVGADFRFGKDRNGDAAFLKAWGQALGFQVEVFDPIIAHDTQKISSSEIRAALKAGRPQDAAKLLGHWWTIEGRVEHGDGRGRELGYPTANMRLQNHLRPAFGIYAVRITVVEQELPVARHCGVASLGIRPMFPADTPLIESCLFDFSGDLYGKHLAVELIAFLRPERKFDSVDQLKAQMALDVTAAGVALDRAGVHC